MILTNENIITGEQYRVIPGVFSSVVVHEDQVYAADDHRNLTRVLQLNETPPQGWRQLKTIDHNFKLKSYQVTLSISKNQLYCYSRGDNIVKVYSLSGELLQPTREINHCADHICWSFIRNNDDDGSVLIDEFDGKSPQVVSEQGELLSLLELKPPIATLTNLVLFKDHVFATSWDTKTIYKYSC